MKPRHPLPALLTALLIGNAWADTYTIDSRHTFPVFEVGHFGFSTQRGRFDKVSGKLELSADGRQAAIDIVIDTASIDMGFETWNKHMRGERFFQTDKYPEAHFTASKIDLAAATPISVKGELSLLGVTRPMTLEIVRWQCAKHPMLPRQLCGADLRATLNRSDFGMNYGLPGISDEIKLFVAVEAMKDEEKAPAEK